MKQIIRDFLNSDMTESEFYNLSQDNLINLKDYLLQLKSKDEQFIYLIKNPYNSMKEKCNWIDNIAFSAIQIKSTGDYYQSSIWLLPTKGNNIITKINKERKVYKDIADKIPKIYLVNKNIKTQIERQEDLKNIQEELHEIDQIGRKYYDGLLYPQKSISENFKMYYTPNIGMSLYSDNQLLANYYIRQMKEYDKPYLNNEEKNKILTRIQIKNK